MKEGMHIVDEATAGAAHGAVARAPRDDFGDRMKAYEAVEDRRLDPSLPIYARIDGRCFSAFTRGMGRPFDRDLSEAMMRTTGALVEAMHARIGYTQSDEISLVWLADGERAEPIFGARVQKLCSVLGAYATAAFTAACTKDRRLREDYLHRLPHFDCRVASLPSKTEAANMILWRETDAYRNAVSAAAQATFSHRQLQGKGREEMLAMLAEAGVDFDAYPPFFKHGTFMRRESFERAFTEAELARIPEKHRPATDALVMRSEVRCLPMPPFAAITNREAVVFDNAGPLTVRSEATITNASQASGMKTNDR